jgi:hypothetical protein
MLLKGGFKSEGNGGFLLSQRNIFQITILIMKFEFPSHIRKQFIQIFCSGKIFGIFFLRSKNLPVSSDLKSPLQYFYFKL